MALDTLVDAYLSHLRVERALSPHTVAAYGRDLSKLVAFAESQGISLPTEIDLGLVSAWLAQWLWLGGPLLPGWLGGP